jgi:hypothetical protein
MSDGLLEDLVRRGLLQPKRRDPRRVRRWLERSLKDLDVVAMLADVDRQRAMAVAYEAGYRACAGILDLGGNRVTSQPGHHRAAIDAATVILGQEHRALLRRLDRARRFRNETLYGDVPTVAEREFDQLVKDVTWLLAELERRLSDAGPAEVPRD